MGAGGMSGAELIALLPDLSKEDKKLPVEERIEVVECEVMPPGETGILVSDEYLVNIYRNSKAIRRFLDDVEEHLENRAIAGDAVPGTKLVEGRAGNRAWANEEEADTFLRGKKLKEAERYNFKLKSPTEMEKVLDIPNQPKRTQTRWNELVVRSPGNPFSPSPTTSARLSVRRLTCCRISVMTTRFRLSPPERERSSASRKELHRIKKIESKKYETSSNTTPRQQVLRRKRQDGLPRPVQGEALQGRHQEHRTLLASSSSSRKRMRRRAS